MVAERQEAAIESTEKLRRAGGCITRLGDRSVDDEDKDRARRVWMGGSRQIAPSLWPERAQSSRDCLALGLWQIVGQFVRLKPRDVLHLQIVWRRVASSVTEEDNLQLLNVDHSPNED